MTRALKLVWANFRYCFIRILEFRTEVVVWSIHSITWALLALVLVYLIFGQVNSIAGWTKNEVLALSLTGSMFNSFLWWFIYPSVLRLINTVRTGDFDFYLLRPASSRFLISVSRFEFDNYPRVFVTAALLIIMVLQGLITVTFSSFVNFVLLFFIGAIVFYCLFFIVATLSFWLIQMPEIENLFDTIVTSGRYPTHIFRGSLRFVFFFIIPMAFVATFPVQALVGRSGFELVLLGCVVVFIFLAFSQWFWNLALRHYSSASS